MRLVYALMIFSTACASNMQMTSSNPAAQPGSPQATERSQQPAPPHPMTPAAEDANRFVSDAESRLAAMNVEQQRAAWVASNFITHDTELLAAKANEHQINLGVDLAKQAARFDVATGLSYADRRKLDLIKLSLTSPGPSDPAKTAEMARIGAELEAMYGSGKYCPPGATPEQCLDINSISRIMRENRDPQRLLEVWRGWHTVSPAMREKYSRYVLLMNEGARELGYKDVGVMWRSKYDMPADAFAGEIDRLWNQVKPLYESLHCYVRWNMTKQYGPGVVPPGKPIPAHLLGNIWAQEWGNVYPLVEPKGLPGRGYDLTKILEARKDVTEIGMVRIGERFFTSLGFDPLPQTFWERSLFTKPRDREVVCHASAWDLDDENDLRIKMCIEKTEEDLTTIHHELGHNFYQRAYNRQPFLYKNSANDGFHEAIGDTIALSVTPGYLVNLGLIDQEPPAQSDIALLLRDAMDKIAFLPFGVMMDKWRWGVFSGQISPADYNKAWWQLRRQYQGIEPTGVRGEDLFDAGAKYHIAANVPYARYFLARILQFQFHRALCQTAGAKGPLNRCSIFGNKEAGARLAKTLEMGQSRPWPDALEAMTGQRQMDATAIIDYFKPLKTWLDEQNKGQVCGW
ncbi:MAG: M2 family metallopeptidase [Thermoanaerobaculia bacterium]